MPSTPNPTSAPMAPSGEPMDQDLVRDDKVYVGLCHTNGTMLSDL